MHLPEQGTLTRGLLAYLAGVAVWCAGMAITQPRRWPPWRRSRR